MSQCDGCGRPIGHAQSIEGEYEQFDDFEKKNKYFGSRECKEIYEEAEGIVEKIECDDCGKLVEKSESVRGQKIVSGIPCKQRYCPECGDGENQ